MRREGAIARRGMPRKDRSAWRSKHRRPPRPPSLGRRGATYRYPGSPETVVHRSGRFWRRYWPKARRRMRRTGRGLRWSRAVLPPAPSTGNVCRHSGTVRLPFRPRCNRHGLERATARPGFGALRPVRKGESYTPERRRCWRMPDAIATASPRPRPRIIYSHPSPYANRERSRPKPQCRHGRRFSVRSTRIAFLRRQQVYLANARTSRKYHMRIRSLFYQPEQRRSSAGFRQMSCRCDPL